MIRLYLSDMINDHKTQEVWKVYLGNKVIDFKNSRRMENSVVNDN